MRKIMLVIPVLLLVNLFTMADEFQIFTSDDYKQLSEEGKEAYAIGVRDALIVANSLIDNERGVDAWMTTKHMMKLSIEEINGIFNTLYAKGRKEAPFALLIQYANIYLNSIK